jgi:hypothetical protein
MQKLEEQISTKSLIMVYGIGETAVHDIGQIVDYKTVKSST